MLQTMLHKANALPPVLSSSSSMQLPMQHDLATMNMLAGSAIPMPVPAPQLVSPVVLASNFPSTGQDIDLRNVSDPRMGRNMDQDMRNINMPVPGPIMNPFDAVPQRNQLQQRPNLQQQQQQQQPTFQSDPRQRPVDPRVKQHQQQQQQPPVVAQQMPIHLPTQQQQQQILSASQSRLPAGIPNNASDQEKAALIMQVLQLSDDQISMLPPEQRASILVLKEQIAKSTQR